MITFEEAKEKALSLSPGVDACNEYDKGYRFFRKDSEEVGDCGVTIVKSNGKAIPFVSFILDYQPNPKFKPVPMDR